MMGLFDGPPSRRIDRVDRPRLIAREAADGAR
jgi:hypothetical protein